MSPRGRGTAAAASAYEQRGVDHKRAICLVYPQVVGIPDWQNDAREMMRINRLKPPAAFKGIYGPLEMTR